MRYAGYYFSSHNAHYIHSPFVYQLYTKVISPDKKQHVFQEIETIRNNFLKDETKIPVINTSDGTTEKSISQIARNTLKGKRYARLLYRLATHFKPRVCIEIGTSLGISTLYLAAATKGKVITLEGNDILLQHARKQFDKTEFGNRIESVQGMFDDTLPKVLSELTEVDFVFFDGNHHYEPTMNYFNHCLGKAHAQSVFIFDDINWSTGMKQAWDDIRQHPKVSVSIDLFMMGIVFFDPDLSKQDFLLRY